MMLYHCRLKDDYVEAIGGIMKHLVKQSYPNKLTFVGELLSGRSYSPKMVSGTFPLLST